MTYRSLLVGSPRSWPWRQVMCTQPSPRRSALAGRLTRRARNRTGRAPKMSRDTNVGFADLLTQMKITNRLLAAPLKTTMGQKDLVRLLASTGATNQEIADVLDTTAATVANTRVRLKKEAPLKLE